MPAAATASPPSRGRVADPLEGARATVAPPSPACHVWGYGDEHTHASFRGALRTFCSRVVRGAATMEPARRALISCRECRIEFSRLSAEGLVGDGKTRTGCRAATRKGLPCRRVPLPGGYCPSHKHLGEALNGR